MDFAVSIIHSVSDLANATEFLCSVLGFQQKEVAKHTTVVENGAITIRLIDGCNDIKNSGLTLELQTQDIAATMLHLLNRRGVSVLNQPPLDFNGQERVEALLSAPHSINILLVQEFNEDQLGIMPPLPTSLIWAEDAESCVKRMLKLVPLSFRQPARVRVTERAEMLAGEEGLVTVNLDQAIRALAQTTPAFQRPVLTSALQQEGIDLDCYFEESAN